MKTIPFRAAFPPSVPVLCALLAAIALPCLAQQVDPAPPPPPRDAGEPAFLRGDPTAFRVEELAPGVLLFRPKSSSRHVNALVFDRSDGLLVVDAQPTEDAARDFLASLRARSGRPVRYLVFSHPHTDACGGSAAFPVETLRIASRGYRDAMADSEFQPDRERRLRRGLPPADVPSERPEATLILFGRTRLEDSRQPVVLLPAPHAHSPGDLLVYQPEAAIVAAGDLPFSDGKPFAGDSRIVGWIGQLDLLGTMAPEVVVPMRGPVADADRLRAARNALDWVREQVDEAFRKRMSPEEIPSEIFNDPDLGRYFTRDPDSPFLIGLIDQVVEEARERRRREGLE